MYNYIYNIHDAILMLSPCRRMLVVFLECARPYMIERQVWCQPRRRQWWLGVISGLWGDNWWWDNLRMSKDTFSYLCRVLHPYVEKEVTRMRDPVSVEERLGVTTWRLATNVEYRTIAELFGLGWATDCTIVLETCRVIAIHLMPQLVKTPQGEALREVVRGFNHLGFPQAAGVVDGTHIPIIHPDENATDFYNRKGFHSIIMQAVVDHRGVFTNIYIGWPGRVHDARVFKNSDLFQKGSNGNLFPDWKKCFGNVNVPLLLLGDPAYPLLPWLMKPYPEHAGMSAKKRKFNYHLSKARVVVENAFGRLKGRWRCLLKRMDNRTENYQILWQHASSCIMFVKFWR